MKSAVFLTVLLLVSINAFKAEENLKLNNGRIIGGEVIDISEAPFTVAILYNKELKCGGTILSKDFVLTTAAPFYSWNSTSDTMYLVLDLNDLDLRAGSNTYYSEGQVVQVNAMEHHPNYKGRSRIPIHDYNVAVMTLKTPLIFDSAVAPVILPLSIDMPIGTAVTLTGWGYTEYNELSSNLKRGEFEIEHNEICMAAFPDHFTERFLCVIHPEMDATAGSDDWGGPLVLKDTRLLLGIMSTLSSVNTPHLYTNIGNREITEFIFSYTGL